MRPQNKHLRPFKPGQSGNPGGKPKQLLTKENVSSLVGKLSNMTREELQAIVADPKARMIEIMIASIMARSAKEGDPQRLEFLLMRSIGRVREELTVTPGVPDDLLDEIPRDKLISLLTIEDGGDANREPSGSV